MYLPVPRFRATSKKLTAFKFASQVILRSKSSLKIFIKSFLFLSAWGPLVHPKQASPLSYYKPSDWNTGQWSVKNSERMKNTGENYLKFHKKLLKFLGKIGKNVFKSKFLRINGSPSIDYNSGLLIIHSTLSHI